MIVRQGEEGKFEIVGRRPPLPRSAAYGDQQN